MPEIRNDNLIQRELKFKKENEGRLRSSIVDTYFLIYEESRDEIIPVRHFDGCVMTKDDVRTVIKGLTNYIENSFTNDDIEKYNEKVKEERDKLLYGDDYSRVKTQREQMSNSTVNEGVVYFIKETFSGTVKIGKTKNLKSRSELFSVKLPFEWEYLKTIESKDYSLTERLLHQTFKDKRVNGEWFALTDDEIKEIIDGEFPDEVLQSIKGEGAIYE